MSRKKKDKVIDLIVKEEKDYNGTYRNKDGVFFRIQWYPGVGNFYIIFNDDPAWQGGITLKQLEQYIKKGFEKV